METEHENLITRHKAVIESHVFIDHEEFKALAGMAMVNDQITEDYDTDKIHSVLDQIAIKCLGYNNWIEAYHDID